MKYVAIHIPEEVAAALDERFELRTLEEVGGMVRTAYRAQDGRRAGDVTYEVIWAEVPKGGDLVDVTLAARGDGPPLMFGSQLVIAEPAPEV